ncbi:Cytochrome c oxidase subunit NDUFA4 [Blattella germanica]|nr:Cytochrome c oxidase subunit NDUFA4 [Blattella germanica]
MKGLSLSSLKSHPALIPLYVCVGMGCAGAFYYTLRLATRSPEVSWNKKTNPEPWNEYSDKQHKFYSPVRDYSTTKTLAPKYD